MAKKLPCIELKLQRLEFANSIRSFNETGATHPKIHGLHGGFCLVYWSCLSTSHHLDCESEKQDTETIGIGSD